MERKKVGLLGYGVVGKRVADAVSLQDDMQLVGIADVVGNALIRVAQHKKYSIFAASNEAGENLEKSGISVSGSLDDLLSKVDIVVDASPPGFPEKNLKKCKDLGIKYICEGGEKHSLTEFSFSSLANYEEAIGKNLARVVSCNTTAGSRVLSTLHFNYGIADCFIAITRRGADPIQIKSGPINASIPALPGFSHHAPDIKTVIKGLNVKSMAVVVSTTLMHIHIVEATLQSKPKREEVIELFQRTPRIFVVTKKDDLRSSAHLLEYCRDLGRPRGDMWEVAIWEESISVEDNKVYFMIGIHMESIIEPENVDCIRAMTNLETSKWKSIYKTDLSLGFAKKEECYH